MGLFIGTGGTILNNTGGRIMQHPRADIPLTVPNLIIRCFAEHKNGVWQAFALEFDLAAQADSFDEVKQKLDSMIDSYVYDALAGEDREHALELLFHRRAPFSLWLKYFLMPSEKDAGVKSEQSRSYREPLRLIPQ